MKTHPFKRRWLSLLFFLKRNAVVYSNLRGLKRGLVSSVRFLVFRFAALLFYGSRVRGPVQGYFSALDLVREKVIEGRVLLRDQGRAQVREPSVMTISGLDQNSEQPWPVFWSRLKTTRLCGVGLTPVNDQKKVCLDAVYGLKHVKKDLVWNYCPVTKPAKLEGRWTSVVSSWVPSNERTNYSHWLFEALPRLAVIEELPDDLNVLIPREVLPFQAESLRWLGLTERVRPTSERHLLVEDFYFSSPPTMIVCYNPYGVDFLRTKFLSFSDKNFVGPNRFFLHRPGQLRGIANERDVVEFFGNLGWSVIDTAVLSLAEQIKLFSQADAVCGPHGAGFSNVAWCKPGCKVIELFSSAHVNSCYEWLSYCVKAEYAYLISPPGKRMNAVVNLRDLHAVLKSVRAI